jgi:hypothetical protein
VSDSCAAPAALTVGGSAKDELNAATDVDCFGFVSGRAGQVLKVEVAMTEEAEVVCGLMIQSPGGARGFVPRYTPGETGERACYFVWVNSGTGYAYRLLIKGANGWYHPNQAYTVRVY